MVSLLLLCSIATSAQSVKFEDYTKAAVSRNNFYYIDKTSIERVSNGNIVFWVMTPNVEKSLLIYLSMEVNCTRRAIRSRSGFVTDGKVIQTENKISHWFPKTDAIANQLISFMCANDA